MLCLLQRQVVGLIEPRIMSSVSNSTLFRGMSIMREVAGSDRGLSVVELVDRVGLPKPTVHRIATQLERQGYLQRNPVDKRFSVGSLLREFSLSILSSSAADAPRRAILERLSQETGETCNCTILDGNQTVYFDRVESNWPIKIDLHPGSRLPIHATASGKLFLAYMKPQTRESLLGGKPLSAETEQTIIEPKQLEEQLKVIRKEAVSYDNEELLDGMVAIAVPVFNSAKRVCFTVAVHAPTNRQTLDSLRQYIPSLRNAAQALSDCYGSARA